MNVNINSKSLMKITVVTLSLVLLSGCSREKIADLWTKNLESPDVGKDKEDDKLKKDKVKDVKKAEKSEQKSKKDKNTDKDKVNETKKKKRDIDRDISTKEKKSGSNTKAKKDMKTDDKIKKDTTQKVTTKKDTKNEKEKNDKGIRETTIVSGEKLVETTDVDINIKTTKVILPGETGNEYGEKPIFAIWYDVLNKADTDVDPITAWVKVFTATQGKSRNEENSVNELEMAQIPDLKHIETMANAIKKGETLESSISYELIATNSPITLIAVDGDKEVGRYEYKTTR